MSDPNNGLMELGVGGLFAIQILRTALPFFAKKWNGNNSVTCPIVSPEISKLHRLEMAREVSDSLKEHLDKQTKILGEIRDSVRDLNRP